MNRTFVRRIKTIRKYLGIFRRGCEGKNKKPCEGKCGVLLRKLTHYLNIMYRSEHRNYRWKNHYVAQLERMYNKGFNFVREEAQRLAQESEKIKQVKAGGACIGENSNKVFRCYTNVNCCEGFSKIYSTPGVVRCRRTSLLKHGILKQCSNKPKGFYNGATLTFEQSLIHPEAHEAWLRNEKGHENSIRNILPKRAKEVMFYLKHVKVLKRQRVALRRANRMRNKARKQVRMALRILAIGEKRWMVTKRDVPAKLGLVKKAHRAVLAAHAGKKNQVHRARIAISMLKGKVAARMSVQRAASKAQDAALKRQLIAMKQVQYRLKERLAARANLIAKSKGARLAYKRAAAKQATLKKFIGTHHTERMAKADDRHYMKGKKKGKKH